jgi:hypothetical protein
MHRRVVALIALAALILAAIVAIAPRSTLIANNVSGEVYGIDLVGLTPNADETTGPRYAKQQ